MTWRVKRIETIITGDTSIVCTAPDTGFRVELQDYPGNTVRVIQACANPLVAPCATGGLLQVLGQDLEFADNDFGCS